MTVREFSVVVPLARLGSLAQEHVLDADPGQRLALAKRFGIAAVDRLHAKLFVERVAGGARLTGLLEADVVQSCVVSGEPVPAAIREVLDLRFEPAPEAEEIELDPDALDVLHIEGDRIDIGEAAAQSLALALEPYPRADPQTLAKARRLLLSEEEAQALAAGEKAAANPFAKLRPQ
ncbi:MAG: YceD family protein [Sandaracinobacteroides sp.]